MDFNYNSIDINPEKECNNIVTQMQGILRNVLKKRGAVVGISGGVDSSVVLALAAKAFGPKKVIGLMLPEMDSSPDSIYLAQIAADQFGVKTIIEDVTNALIGFECYSRRDEAIKRIFPEYNSNYKMKIVLPEGPANSNTLNIFSAVIIAPDGTTQKKRLPLKEYLQIVAASNFKQRCRMSMLFYYAEKNNYAVMGTGNKNEHLQGFFVKYGDGGADIKPIAHLFKTQVYQLAEYLGVPEEIRKREPTTDTYTAEQSQQEFFFQTPFEILDRIWYAWEKGIPESVTAKVLNVSVEYVLSVQKNIISKNSGTEYLRLQPLELSSEINI